MTVGISIFNPSLLKLTSTRQFVVPHAQSRSSLAPFIDYYQEIRLQVAKLEGLESLPLDNDLREQTSLNNLSLRSGIFHSDRIRLGNFLYIRSGSGTAILSCTLWPTSYSNHPILILDVASLYDGDEWVVAMDYIPIGSSDHDKRMMDSLISIKNEYKDLVVDVSDNYLDAQLGMSRGFMMMSSTQIQDTREPREVLEREALDAFRKVLSTHLNGLVSAPLDASPVAVAAVTKVHAQLAEYRQGINPLGWELLESEFGTSYVSRLQEEVLNGWRGLYSNITAVDWQDPSSDQDTDLIEYLYLNPRFE